MLEEKKETTEAPRKVKKASVKKATGPFVYMGPTILSIASFGTIYSDYPEHAKEEIEKNIELKALFVPLKDYPKAESQIRNRSGYYFEMRTKVQKKYI